VHVPRKADDKRKNPTVHSVIAVLLAPPPTKGKGFFQRKPHHRQQSRGGRRGIKHIALTFGTLLSSGTEAANG